LGEGHAEELVPAGEGFDFEVAVVALDALAKFVDWQKVHQLGENGFSGIHEPTPSSLMRKYGISGNLNSNR